MKQTAMQMAIDHYKKLSEQGSNQAYVVAKFLEENFLEVEKEQLTNCFEHGDMVGRASIVRELNSNDKVVLKYPEISAEEYYNKIFKSE